MTRPSRRFRSHAVWTTVFVAYIMFATAPAAHAYIDPGSVSLIWQAVLGVFLGAAVALKVFWRRIWGFLTRRSVKDRTPSPE